MNDIKKINSNMSALGEITSADILLQNIRNLITSLSDTNLVLQDEISMLRAKKNVLLSENVRLFNELQSLYKE